jgi:CBS domain-containing protein
MGEKKVTTETDEAQLRQFTRSVLDDLQALEMMIRGGYMENSALRIGAEQEMFLVESSMHPAPLAMEIIEDARDRRLTTEIGRFNIEANLTPLDFTGKCLSTLEGEIDEMVGVVRRSAAKHNADVVLAGILPTIQSSDLVERNLTPSPRYHELNRILTALHGEERIVHIKGLDELRLHVQNTFVEFCNTSFQVHLQVPIDRFVEYYNWAQALSAPVLGSAVNSPVIMGHRLWHETRLAIFQHAVDSRSPVQQERSHPARVTFGRTWVEKSILDVFHEDVARFRILLTRELEEDSLDSLKEGRIPGLDAWRMHNGTIWRWNRACYGVMNDRPGLRIEVRYLPSGPTVVDEVANAAFFLGLMMALPEEFGDITRLMSFDDAKNNFFSSARYGLKSQLIWFRGQSFRTARLILEDLAPRAREGLKAVGVDAGDIDRYIGIIEERVRAEKTGSLWVLDSLARMDKTAKLNVRMRTVTASMLENQLSGEPVHKWPPATISEKSDWIDNYRTVEQFMSKDLFTVRPHDAVDLAASLMNWKHIRHVPVEDDAGNLVGILSHRDLLKLMTEHCGEEIVVRDVMKTDLITAPPEMSSLEALKTMRDHDIGCLPVVHRNRLVGLITAYDFLTVSVKLFEERVREDFGREAS